jgi:hypothetical protein
MPDQIISGRLHHQERPPQVGPHHAAQRLSDQIVVGNDPLVRLQARTGLERNWIGLVVLGEQENQVSLLSDGHRGIVLQKSPPSKPFCSLGITDLRFAKR